MTKATGATDYSRHFSFFESFWQQMQLLDIGQRGQYVTAMCKMAFDGEDTEFEDPMLAIAWAVMRAQVAESVKINGRNRANGAKGGRPRRSAKSDSKTKNQSVKPTGLRSAKTNGESERKGKERNGTEVNVPFPTERNGAPSDPQETGPGAPASYLIDPDNPKPLVGLEAMADGPS